MSAVAVVSPYVPILNLAGAGLNEGHLYVGVLGEDPQTNPQAVYWDTALTIPATQPLDVIGGYVYRSGTPSQAYTASAASLRVLDANNTLVWNGSTNSVTIVNYVTLPFEFLGGVAPASNEVMGLYVAERALTIFGNFDGSGSGFAAPKGKCLSAPSSGAFVITVNKNGSAIGTITVAQSTGVFSFATTAGASYTLAAGDNLSFVAQTSVDNGFINSAWTLTLEATS